MAKKNRSELKKWKEKKEDKMFILLMTKLDKDVRRLNREIIEQKQIRLSKGDETVLTKERQKPDELIT